MNPDGSEETVGDPLVDLMRAERERRREREANRGYAAITLAPSVVVAQALYRGRPVPREALAPEFRDRVICWDGVLTDDVVLDVLVLLEADRQAGDLPEPEPVQSWLRQQHRTARAA